MVDGYRVMFAYPGESYFANLKVEISASGEYLGDREAIVAHLADAAPGAVIRKKYGGFDLYAVDKATIETSGTIGIYVLFKDATRTVVTIYFLNQRPDARHFKTLREYQDLRDSFLQGYVECLDAV